MARFREAPAQSGKNSAQCVYVGVCAETNAKRKSVWLSGVNIMGEGGVTCGSRWRWERKKGR